MKSAQTGAALILVLWVSALLAVLAGAFAISARTENLQARYLFESARARAIAEAGLAWAVVQAREVDPETRWIADGRAYEVEFEGATIELRLHDETGKIDINFADQQLLMSLFQQAGGLDQQDAERLAAAVIDWRDADDLLTPGGAEGPEYEALGLPYGPKDGPFDTVDELQQVAGMDYSLFKKLEPAITVYSSRPTPNPAFAPAEALAALPGMTSDLAQQFVEQRLQVTQPGVPLPSLPDGSVPVAEGGGLTYTIESRATMPNRSQATVIVTIRMGGTMLLRPYRVVRWRDGDFPEDA